MPTTSELRTLYQTWGAMRHRCNSPKSRFWKNYGGRGITITKDWDSFDIFVHDMFPKPPHTSLDRIDNNGPYNKENCTWSTTKQQSRNKRTTRVLTFNGRTQCIADWVTETGLSHSTICNRIKLNWPVEKILTTTPIQSKTSRSRKSLTYDNRTLSIIEWAQELKVSQHTLYSRLKYGWSDERILTTPIKQNRRTQNAFYTKLLGRLTSASSNQTTTQILQ